MATAIDYRLFTVYALGSIAWSVGMTIFCFENSGTNFGLLFTSALGHLLEPLMLLWPVTLMLLLGLVACVRSAPKRLKMAHLIYLSPLALSESTNAWGLHCWVSRTYLSASFLPDGIFILHVVLVSAALALCLFRLACEGGF